MYPGVPLTGLKLEPKIWVRVDSNLADASVRFSSERATLGDPRLDATFQLNMSSTLSSYGGVSLRFLALCVCVLCVCVCVCVCVCACVRAHVGGDV